MLELAILGLLAEQDLHGYELKKRLNDTLGLLLSVSYGSLYPALARLEAEGAVTVAALEAGHEPEAPLAAHGALTGSLGGERAAFQRRVGARRAPSGFARASRPRRQRKVYSITAAGRQLFDELLSGRTGEREASEDDKGFALRLAFARHLAPEARLRLLERRRAVLSERLAPSTRPAPDPYRAALAERRSEALGADLRWLDRLIEAEAGRHSSVPADAPALQSLTGHAPRATPDEPLDTTKPDPSPTPERKATVQ